MWDYSDKVKDHFLHPRNARVIPDANGIGDVGSIICGDALRLMLKINPITNVIEDASFQTYGCGSAIASSSALTEMIKGKTVEEAQKITNQDIADYLDGLPPEKMHCSVMGREALDAAVANYHGKTYEQSHDDGEIVCHCFGVGINKIKKAVWENHLTTVEEVTNYTKAGGGCQSCHMRIEEIIEEVWVDLEKCGVARPGFVPTPLEGIKIATSTTRVAAPAAQAAVSSAPAAAAPAAPAAAAAAAGSTESSPYYAGVKECLTAINDGLPADGSGIELVSIEGKKVVVRMSGPVAEGLMAEMTLTFAAKKLQNAVDSSLEVVREQA